MKGARVRVSERECVCVRMFACVQIRIKEATRLATGEAAYTPKGWPRRTALALSRLIEPWNHDTIRPSSNKLRAALESASRSGPNRRRNIKNWLWLTTPPPRR